MYADKILQPETRLAAHSSNQKFKSLTMIKNLLDDPWKTGLAIGLIIGGLLSLLLHFGWHQDIGIEKPVRWLASCPPLTWRWVMDLAYEVQQGILIAWWAGVGAALGWLIDGNKADKACAVLLATTLIAAHHLAYNNLGLSVERQIRHFKMEVDRMF